MHRVLASITVKPEAAAQAAAILTELVAQSRQEPGCVSYELYQQSATPHVCQTVEQWQDAAAADAHMGTPPLGAPIAAATALFAAPPEILAYDKLA